MKHFDIENTVLRRAVLGNRFRTMQGLARATDLAFREERMAAYCAEEAARMQTREAVASLNALRDGIAKMRGSMATLDMEGLTQVMLEKLGEISTLGDR